MYTHWLATLATSQDAQHAWDLSFASPTSYSSILVANSPVSNIGIQIRNSVVKALGSIVHPVAAVSRVARSRCRVIQLHTRLSDMIGFPPWCNKAEITITEFRISSKDSVPTEGMIDVSGIPGH